MPKLACRTCGRQVETATPFPTAPGGEAVAGNDARCPRCGAYLAADRRLGERRLAGRRVNLPTDPGPPAGIAERRISDRRATRRRRLENGRWRPR